MKQKGHIPTWQPGRSQTETVAGGVFGGIVADANANIALVLRGTVP